MSQTNNSIQPPPPKKFELHEIGSTYAGPEDRFLVSLVVGYEPGEGVHTPEQALSRTLEMIQESESRGDTQWHVHDRKTGITHVLEQKQAEPSVEEEES
jgi:hypothetical protein